MRNQGAGSDGARIAEAVAAAVMALARRQRVVMRRLARIGGAGDRVLAAALVRGPDGLAAQAIASG